MDSESPGPSEFQTHLYFQMKIIKRAIRFKVEQWMEGARKDRHTTKQTGGGKNCT